MHSQELSTPEFRRVLVIGAGTMGQQIALQCAMYGLEVALYDIVPEALETADRRIRGYTDELNAAGAITADGAAAALARITRTSDPAAAAQNADLVSESVLEDPKIKGQVFAKFHSLCPPHAIFTTNSSSLIPSQIAPACGRPALFCAFHFHNPVWSANVVDIMPHPGTDPAVVDRLHAFARCINQIPIYVQKETPNYVFNAMLGGVLTEALKLGAKGVASVEEIDRAWMGVTKMPVGPFGVMDLIGLDLIYHIWKSGAGLIGRFIPSIRRVLEFQERLVLAGKLGIKSGEGYYQYPNPAYSQPCFVEGKKV